MLYTWVISTSYILFPGFLIQKGECIGFWENSTRSTEILETLKGEIMRRKLHVRSLLASLNVHARIASSTLIRIRGARKFYRKRSRNPNRGWYGDRYRDFWWYSVYRLFRKSVSSTPAGASMPVTHGLKLDEKRRERRRRWSFALVRNISPRARDSSRINVQAVLDVLQ